MTIGASTCLVSFVLEDRTLLVFRRLRQKHKRQRREDFRLLIKPALRRTVQVWHLVYAVFGFVAQLMVAIWNILHCGRCLPNGGNLRSRFLPVLDGHSSLVAQYVSTLPGKKREKQSLT